MTLTNVFPEATTFIDEFQGADPEAIEAREGMPEPGNCTMQRFQVLCRPPPILSDVIMDFSPSCALPRRLEFERVKMSVGRIVFWAWKYKRDGKVYV